MTRRRPPRTLPGKDALRLRTITLILLLGTSVVLAAVDVFTTTWRTPHVEHLPYLPLPIFTQWRQTAPLTISLGLLALALVAGLAWGVPLGLRAARQFEIAHAVDVTELPTTDWSMAYWSARPRESSPGPGELTRSEYWLGRGRRQRVLSLLALVPAVLLPLGFFAALIAAGWYGISYYPDCVGSRCPPSYSQFASLPWLLGLGIMLLIQYAQVRAMERRCGIRFRMAEVTMPGNLTSYVRAPGVAPEAAAAALARYRHDSRGGERPAARRMLVTMLYFVPFFLLQITLTLLTAWLPTQWSPT